MHPLWFPNSGIRAKAARRRGGQPRPAPMQGRPPTARPAARGNRPRPKPLVGVVASMRGRPRACLVLAGVGNARGQAAGGGYLLRGQGCRLQGGTIRGQQRLP
ncbi:hypothetical protein BHE74_00049491 [Ensete ventricosum]|nr:hypothetical protein BHE74_00049491 [Ensete ventricosum]